MSQEFEIHGASEKQAQELRAIPAAIPSQGDEAKRLAREIASAYENRPAGKFCFEPPMPEPAQLEQARTEAEAASLALRAKTAQVEAKKSANKKAKREALRPYVERDNAASKALHDLESQAAQHLASAEHLRAIERQVAIIIGNLDADWVVSGHELRGVVRVPMKDGQTLRLAVTTIMEYGVVGYLNVGPCPTDKSLDGKTDREIAQVLRYSWVRPFFTLRQCQNWRDQEQAWGLDIQPVSLAPSDIEALIACTHLAAGWAKALHEALIPSLSWLFELGYRLLDGREGTIKYTSRATNQIEEPKP